MEFDYKDPNTGKIKTDKGGNRWWQEENEKYIIDLMNSGEYTPDQWADLVGKYAQYSIGKNRDRNDGVYQGRFDKTLTKGKRDVTEKNGLWDKLVRAVGGENPDVSGVKDTNTKSLRNLIGEKITKGAEGKWKLPTFADKNSSTANKTWNLPSLGGIINEYNKKQQSNKIVEKAATKTTKTVEKAATKGAANAVKNTVDKVVSEAMKNEKVKKAASAAKTETKSKKIASTSKKLTQQAKKRDSASKKKTTAKKSSTSSKSKKKAQSKKKTTTKKKKK